MSKGPEYGEVAHYLPGFWLSSKLHTQDIKPIFRQSSGFVETYDIQLATNIYSAEIR